MPNAHKVAHVLKESVKTILVKPCAALQVKAADSASVSISVKTRTVLQENSAKKAIVSKIIVTTAVVQKAKSVKKPNAKIILVIRKRVLKEHSVEPVNVLPLAKISNVKAAKNVLMALVKQILVQKSPAKKVKFAMKVSVSKTNA